MKLLDRYLESVRKHLPWQRQDDIIAELRANLESQLEEKEAVLGRALTDAEAEVWIKSLGAPMQMAAPYQSQQYLIGPNLFPIYRQVLKLACSWGLIIYSIATVATIFASQKPMGHDLLLACLRLPNVLLTIAAWVTLVFAAAEFAFTHGFVPKPESGPFSAGWSPDIPSPLDLDMANGQKPKSFAMAVAEAVFSFFFLIWLLLIPHNHWLLMGPGAIYYDNSPYELAPVWMRFYWCLVAMNIFQVGWNFACLQGGRYRRSHPVKHLVPKALIVLACAFLLTTSDHLLLFLKNPSIDQAHYGATLATANFDIYRALMVVTALAALQLLWEIGKLALNAYRSREAALQ